MRPLTSATGLEPNDILRFILDDPYGQAKAGDEVTVREVRNGFIVLKESRVDGYHPSKFAWVRRPGSALQETDRRNEIFQLKMDGLRDQMNALQAFRRVLTEHRIERASGQVEMLRPEDVEALMQKLAAVLPTTPARAEAQDEGAAGEWPEKWSGPCAVGNMIANLRTLPPEMPIYTAYHIPMDGEPSLLRVKRPTVSRERVDGITIKTGDESIPYSAVIWTQPQDPNDAHSSPPFAADEDRVRIAVEALETARGHTQLTHVYAGINQSLAALKSTAAKEGDKPRTYTCTSGRGDSCTCYACHGG